MKTPVSAVPSSVEDLERQRREADEESRKSFSYRRAFLLLAPAKRVFSVGYHQQLCCHRIKGSSEPSSSRRAQQVRRQTIPFVASSLGNASEAVSRSSCKLPSYDRGKVELDIFTIAKGDTEEQEEVFNKVVCATRANASAGRLRTGEINAGTIRGNESS